MTWVVVKTLCYPREYKVTYFIWGRDAGDNSLTNYFVSPTEAQKEADRRNQQ